MTSELFINRCFKLRWILNKIKGCSLHAHGYFDFSGMDKKNVERYN